MSADPIRRELWAAAHRHVVDHHGPNGVRQDDPSVVALTNLLVSAWEGGAQRSLIESAAINKALATIAGHGEPVTVVASKPV
jgi:hypothetical protein